MSSFISSLKDKLSSGEYDPKKGGKPRVGEGTYDCLVTEALFGKGENGNPRGMVTCRVLGGGKVEEVGGEFRIYLQTVNEKYAIATIKEWVGLLTEIGIPEAKIMDDDAESIQDVVSSIMSICNKLALRNKLKLVIERKAQPKLDREGRPQYWNNIQRAEKVDTEAPALSLQAGPASSKQIEALSALSDVPLPMKRVK